MLQKTYSIDLVETYLKDYPNPKNKDLYSFCNATTDSQKQCVRRKKLSLQKKLILPSQRSKTQTLTSADLERRIIEALNKQPNNAQILGKAIDFFIKVKDKTSEMEEEIDIKELINSGIVKKFND